MKVLIIGGVAAGTKVAAKLKREDPSTEVAIITKSKDISYASCGMPYYVGDVVKEKSQLIVNTPQAFEQLVGVTVITETEVTNVNPTTKTVTATNLITNEQVEYIYDKLVVASGTSPIKPSIEGVELENVFTLHAIEDAVTMRTAIEAGGIKRVLIAGAGYIGLEAAENLHALGIRVTMIDKAEHILPNALDPEISDYLENRMAQVGVMPFTGVTLESITGDSKVEKVLTSKRAMKTDAVLLDMGIKPNTAFLENSGVAMENGVIVTDSYMRTSMQDIYAVGDCAQVHSKLTNSNVWSPMATTASAVGRVLAQNIAGKHIEFVGVMGTSIAKLPGDVNLARTGYTETSAKKAGYDVETVLIATDDKANYYPDAGVIIIKLVADKNTRKILGAQVLGNHAVDKVIDIVVTAMSLGATVEQIQGMDFAYSPPFSTAIHPLTTAINVLINKMDGKLKSMTPTEYKNIDITEYKVVDISRKPAVAGADYISLANLQEETAKYAKDDKLLLVCTKGRRAYLAQNKLESYGFTNTVVLEAGTTFTEIDLTK